jgi:hypothetical protein
MSPFHASPSLAGQQQTMHRPMTKRFVTLPKPSPDPAARRSTQSKYASGMCHALTCSGSRMLNVRLCRCMAHSLNLAAKHVLEAFALTPHRVLAKGKHSCTAEPVDDDEEEEEEEEIESDEEEDGESEEEEDGEVDESELVDFQPGDILGKAHAFVTQACPHFDGSCHVVSDSSHL